MVRLTPARLAAALAALALTGAAADPAERLPDPVAEARAEALFGEFRCLVCQNESIADSEAGLARDLRRAVREQVAQGRSDQKIKGFMTERYGEFVLLRPAFSLGNALLWLTPLLVLLAGVAGFFALRRPAPEPPLTPDEEAALTHLNESDTFSRDFAAPGPQEGPRA